MSNSLGTKIKKHRKEKKFTLDTLAKASEISKSYLWELENNDSKKPSAEILARIANNLDVTTSYLLDNNENEIAEDEKDEVFFRNYKNMDSSKKEQLQSLMEFLKAQG